MELVYMPDLESGAARREGSSPSTPTTIIKKIIIWLMQRVNFWLLLKIKPLSV